MMANFCKTIKVYYEDTDAGGIVYHSNYLKYMERCRSDWLDSLGYDVQTVVEKFSVSFVVKSVLIDYDSPAYLMDELVVDCQTLQVGKVSMLIGQTVYNQQRLLCSAKVKLASLDSQTMVPKKMPETLYQILRQTL